MKAKRTLIVLSLLFLVSSSGLQAADVLEPAATIDLPAVKGRIDHFGIDLKQRRLFVAALGNDTLHDLGDREISERKLPPVRPGEHANTMQVETPDFARETGQEFVHLSKAWKTILFVGPNWA